MYEVKQSTALTLPFFAHDVSGDAVTGLTDGSFTKRISKNGAAFGAMTVTITELENGWYSIPLSSSHSDTLGLLTIVFTNAGAKQVNLQFRVEAKLIDDLNDVAATDIVSAGAITTLTGAVVNVDTVDSLTANADKTGYSLSATGLDAIAQSALGMIEIAKAVADLVITGATHNIVDSIARRIRDLQEFGTYDGFIWIDTVNGSVGTTDFESGTYNNKVNNIADATTLATSQGINAFKVSPGSTITLAQTYNNFIFEGDGWTLILNGQDIAGSHFTGADVSGVASGVGTNQEYHDCMMGNTSHIKDTHILGGALTGDQILVEAGDFFVANAHMGASAGNVPSIDFGALIGSSVVHVHAWNGRLTFKNMGQTGTDELHMDGQGLVTFDADCVGGTINLRGLFELVNNGSGLTINDDARYDQAQILQALTSDDVKFQGADIAIILADTNELQTDDVPGLIAALNDIAASDILTTALTESYAADGVAPTLAQAIFMIQQQAGEFAVISTTLTVKKLDGSTTAATFTLDDATNPTSRTRAT